MHPDLSIVCAMYMTWTLLQSSLSNFPWEINKVFWFRFLFWYSGIQMCWVMGNVLNSVQGLWQEIFPVMIFTDTELYEPSGEEALLSGLLAMDNNLFSVLLSITALNVSRCSVCLCRWLLPKQATAKTSVLAKQTDRTSPMSFNTC